MKKKVLRRFPPGDRWVEVEEPGISESEFKLGEGKKGQVIGESLTEALNYLYQKYKVKIFEVNANDGTVSIDDGVKEPVKVKKYSLYDEE